MLRRALALSFIALSFVVVSLVAASSSAFAQKPPAAPKGTTILLDAKVDQVVPQGILATDKGGKKYAVGFDAKSKIGLKGNADIDYVTPGSYVQFDVELDAEGKPATEVKKIQITEQSAITEPGIFSSKGPDGKPGEPGPYFVRGTVRTNRDGNMTVAAGNKQITIKVAEGVTVPVTLADWRMAKPGDAIKGNGTAYPQAGAPTLVLGTLMEITAAGPIEKKRGR